MRNDESSRSRLPWAILAALSYALTGCGGAGLASVTGKVVFADQTPVTGGSVVFDPHDGGRFGAQAVLATDGTFRLGTHAAGDGAHPGKYRVAIQPDDDKNKTIAKRFHSPKTSGLEYTVAPGSNNFTITLTGPAKKKK